MTMSLQLYKSFWDNSGIIHTVFWTTFSRNLILVKWCPPLVKIRNLSVSITHDTAVDKTLLRLTMSIQNILKLLYSEMHVNWDRFRSFFNTVLPSNSPVLTRTTAPPLAPQFTAQVVCSITGLFCRWTTLESIPEVSDGPQLFPKAPKPSTSTSSPGNKQK